jgi:hypothetical protein
MNCSQQDSKAAMLLAPGHSRKQKALLVPANSRGQKALQMQHPDPLVLFLQVWSCMSKRMSKMKKKKEKTSQDEPCGLLHERATRISAVLGMPKSSVNEARHAEDE